MIDKYLSEIIIVLTFVYILSPVSSWVYLSAVLSLSAPRTASLMQPPD